MNIHLVQHGDQITVRFPAVPFFQPFGIFITIVVNAVGQMGFQILGLELCAQVYPLLDRRQQLLNCQLNNRRIVILGAGRDYRCFFQSFRHFNLHDLFGSPRPKGGETGAGQRLPSQIARRRSPSRQRHRKKSMIQPVKIMSRTMAIAVTTMMADARSFTHAFAATINCRTPLSRPGRRVPLPIRRRAGFWRRSDRC
ncbi:hypothetical protein D3C87_1402320 [compost metagenome]